MQENSTGKALGWEPSEVVDIRAQHRFERRSKNNAGNSRICCLVGSSHQLVKLV